METDTSFALRTAATYGAILIVMIWLIRSALKRWRANKGLTQPHTSTNRAEGGNMVALRQFLRTRWHTALILLVLVLVFYWFAYRPQAARRECARSAETKARLDYSYSQENFHPQDFVKYYDACIKQHGY